MAGPAKRAIPGLWTGGCVYDYQVSAVFESIGQKEICSVNSKYTAANPYFE